MFLNVDNFLQKCITFCLVFWLNMFLIMFFIHFLLPLYIPLISRMENSCIYNDILHVNMYSLFRTYQINLSKSVFKYRYFSIKRHNLFNFLINSFFCLFVYCALFFFFVQVYVSVTFKIKNSYIYNDILHVNIY